MKNSQDEMHRKLTIATDSVHVWVSVAWTRMDENEGLVMTTLHEA